jgi:hypothetical protein
MTDLEGTGEYRLLTAGPLRITHSMLPRHRVPTNQTRYIHRCIPNSRYPLSASIITMPLHP